MQNILGTVDFDNIEFSGNMIITPLKYYRCWGTGYMLMDSQNFMGGTDYMQIIDMFQKIWDMNN